MDFPKTFTDALGRTWTVDLTVGILRRLAQAPLSFRLEEAMPSKIEEKTATAAIEAYQAFLNDDLRFGDVLFNIIKPDADAKGINQEQFEAGLKGEANQAAICAFHAAFTDFSSAPRKMILRGLQVTMAKATKFQAMADQKMAAEAELLTEAAMASAIDTAIQRARDEHSGATSPAESPAPSLKLATGSAAM